MNFFRTHCFHPRDLAAKTIGLLFLASISIASSQSKDSLLGVEQVELANGIMVLIEECEKDRSLASAEPETYPEHGYWSRMFKLGNSVTAGQEDSLIAATDFSLVERLALIARAAVTRREKLDELVQRYKSEFIQNPIRRGSDRVPLRTADCTGETTLLWEGLLLSPRIGALAASRCAEALGRCGTIHSLLVIHHARHRLIAGCGSSFRVSLRDDIGWLGPPAASALDNWISLVVKIDEGGKDGLYWLLRALDAIEEEYPEIATLEKYAESKLYDASSPGVSVYILKNVFPKKTEDGSKLVWKDAFGMIAADQLSDRGRKVVQQVKQEVFRE